MDVFYIICFIVIIVMLIINQNNLNGKIADLQFLIIEMQKMIKKLSEAKPSPQAPLPTVVAPEESAVIPEVVKAPEIVKPIPPEPLHENIEWHKEVITPPLPEFRQNPIKPAIPTYKSLEQEHSFFEKHPDLEKFIGENLVNKIGIAILVLAIGFFVKYAIDNDWVGPAGRVGIGVMCGGILNWYRTPFTQLLQSL